VLYSDAIAISGVVPHHDAARNGTPRQRRQRLGVVLWQLRREHRSRANKKALELSRTPDADGLRLRAVRYLAMAFKAREDGEAGFATRLTERATELIEEAATLAKCSTPEPEASPEPSGQLHPAFGQVIIPPRPR
jgi:hypothetical protein